MGGRAPYHFLLAGGVGRRFRPTTCFFTFSKALQTSLSTRSVVVVVNVLVDDDPLFLLGHHLTFFSLVVNISCAGGTAVTSAYKSEARLRQLLVGGEIFLGSALSASLTKMTLRAMDLLGDSSPAAKEMQVSCRRIVSRGCKLRLVFFVTE